MLEMHFEANFRVLFQGFDKWTIIAQKAQSIFDSWMTTNLTICESFYTKKRGRWYPVL